MLLIQVGNRLARDARALPSVTVVGFGVIALAGVMEVLLYLAAGDPAGHLHGGFAPERGAHLLSIIGMVLALAGVLHEAARQSTRRSSAKTGGLNPHAHR
ncbi:MAG TPA: hypothetical protein VJY85_04855 [Candidatus Limnocylindria bacterium]|nr:hypothetical protein [Candidatus Limnocylindria bacterium]